MNVYIRIIDNCFEPPPNVLLYAKTLNGKCLNVNHLVLSIK